MSRLNTLYMGEPEEVITALEDEPIDEQETRMTLQNAMRLIAELQSEVTELREQIGKA